MFLKCYYSIVKVYLDALQMALPGLPGGAVCHIGVIYMSNTGRIYEDILDYLRDEYPEESEEELERLADIVFRAWIDGVI